VLLAAAGVGLLSQAPLRQSVPVVALVAVLVAVLCLSQAAVLVRRFPPVHPVTMNAVGMLTAAAGLLVASRLAGESWAVPAQRQTWLALAYLVLAGSVLLFVCYLLILRHWDASRAAYVYVLSPLGALALSAWLDGEPVGPRTLLGALVVLGGVYLGALRRRASPVDISPRPG
jgi:drug/metabolite transporter (DMT)-like permease